MYWPGLRLSNVLHPGFELTTGALATFVDWPLFWAASCSIMLCTPLRLLTARTKVLRFSVTDDGTKPVGPKVITWTCGSAGVGEACAAGNAECGAGAG